MEALAANTSLYPSGASVVIDNDVTCSLEQLHKRVDTVIEMPTDGSPPLIYDIDVAQCMDVRGQPLTQAKKDAVVAGCPWAHA